MNGRIITRPGTESPRLKFPRIGKIKIGMKNAKGFPQSVDYFIATGKYAGLFTQAYGEKPQTIQIVFPDDDPATVCNEIYTYRDNSGALLARGDGSIFEVWNGKQYVKYNIEQYPDIMERITRNNPTKKGAENWEIELTLRFIIPKIRGVVGVWELVTKGRASSIQNIKNSFDSVQVIRGSVTQTVFDLSVQFAKSNKPGVNSRYPVINIVANDNRIEEIKQMLQPQTKINLLIQG